MRALPTDAANSAVPSSNLNGDEAAAAVRQRCAAQRPQQHWRPCVFTVGRLNGTTSRRKTLFLCCRKSSKFYLGAFGLNRHWGRGSRLQL